MAGNDPWPEIDEADAITIVRRFFIVFLEIFVDEVEGGRFATAPLTMEAMTYPLGTRRVRITLPLGEWREAEAVFGPRVHLRQVVANRIRVLFLHLPLSGRVPCRVP